MNTIRELKQQEKYKNMLKRKNKEKNVYKTQNSTLRIKYEGIKKLLEKKDKEIERLKSNEKTLANLLDKEQKKNKKAIEYIKLKWSYEKLDEVGRNDAIGEPGKTIYEDILREEDTKKVLEILKGNNNEEDK